MLVEEDKSIDDITNYYDKFKEKKKYSNFEFDENLKEILLNDEVKIVLGALTQMGKESIEPLKKLFESYEELFNKKFDLNRSGGMWTCPLSYALFLREEEVALFLIDYGADVNFLDEMGCLPINYSVGVYDFNSQVRLGKIITLRENKELPKAVVSLIVNGANIGHCNPINQCFPCYEAIVNNFSFSSKQIQKRIDTILKNRIPEEMEMIDEYIENRRQTSDTYNSFFKYLADGNEEKSIDLLEKNKYLVTALDSFGQNALHYAVKRRMKKMIKKLIYEGVDYDRKSFQNVTPIEIARTFPPKNYCEIHKYLCQCISDKNIKLKETESKNSIQSKYSNDSLGESKHFNSTDSGYTDSEENSDTSPIIKNKNSQRNGHFVTLNEDIVKAAKADELADKIIKEEELEIEKRIEEQKRKQLKKLKDQRKKNEERLKRERKEKAKKEEIRIMNEKKEEEIRLLRQKREEENQKRIELSLKIERENRIKENIEIFEYFAQKIKIDSDTNKKREAFNRLRSNPMNLINKVKKKKKKKGMISSNQNDSDQFISGEKNPLDTEGSPTDSSYSSESDQISTISDQNSYIGTEETVKEPLNRIDIVDSKDYKATKLEHLKYHLFLFFQHEKEKNNIDDNTEFKNFLFESENNLEFWKNNNTKELDNNLVDTLIKYINSQRNYQSTDGY